MSAVIEDILEVFTVALTISMLLSILFVLRSLETKSRGLIRAKIFLNYGTLKTIFFAMVLGSLFFILSQFVRLVSSNTADSSVYETFSNAALIVYEFYIIYAFITLHRILEE